MTTHPIYATCPVCGTNFDKRYGYVALNGDVVCAQSCRTLSDNGFQITAPPPEKVAAWRKEHAK